MDSLMAHGGMTHNLFYQKTLISPLPLERLRGFLASVREPLVPHRGGGPTRFSQVGTRANWYARAEIFVTTGPGPAHAPPRPCPSLREALRCRVTVCLHLLIWGSCVTVMRQALSPCWYRLQ